MWPRHAQRKMRQWHREKAGVSQPRRAAGGSPEPTGGPSPADAWVRDLQAADSGETVQSTQLCDPRSEQPQHTNSCPRQGSRGPKPQPERTCPAVPGGERGTRTKGGQCKGREGSERRAGPAPLRLGPATGHPAPLGRAPLSQAEVSGAPERSDGPTARLSSPQKSSNLPVTRLRRHCPACRVSTSSPIPQTRRAQSRQSRGPGRFPLLSLGTPFSLLQSEMALSFKQKLQVITEPVINDDSEMPRHFPQVG